MCGLASSTFCTHPGFYSQGTSLWVTPGVTHSEVPWSGEHEHEHDRLAHNKTPWNIKNVHTDVLLGMLNVPHITD